ncbi:MAG: ATP-binding cassette, subfamily F, member 3 [Parcubacteria bacterium C7867-005]|nr:MAG: ATP-binding cassette, subfamily F, member 3 [Parcubacteria bacterium C7867-005]
MSRDETILRFEDVSFEYEQNKPILDGVVFSVRRNSKITIMGQNGGGKSTIFGLITKKNKPEEGNVFISNNVTIAIARQVIPRDELDLTVRDFFIKAFDDSVKAGLRKSTGKMHDIDPKIDDVLEVVNLKGHEKMHDRIMKTFSGGQQARLLLASALIQDPDLLLLDEPTNNLDKAGIEHLTEFLKAYTKTVMVISHDADFLNAFTDGVLYLDVFTKKVEQYVGNYFDVVEQIRVKVEKDERKNALLAKEIQENKDKANFFANKGGQMRLVARRMRDKAEELEESKVDTRREDKTIRPFVIPAQAGHIGNILTITDFETLNPKTHKPQKRKTNIVLRQKQHLLLKGPNGIGKSTLLESIAKGTASGSTIMNGTSVGYYRQDFSTLNFEDTVRDSLMGVMKEKIEENMRSTAAGFLITGDLIKSKIGSLSEGQKGLVAFARLVLQKPGLLILDEPTNHINFRHLPIIAEALNKYEGAMVLVSHVPDFVAKIRIDETLDLEK